MTDDKDFDPSKPLDNARWEAFCRLICGVPIDEMEEGIGAKNPAQLIAALSIVPDGVKPQKIGEAYVNAGFKASTKKIACSNGRHLLEKDIIRSRILSLKQHQADALIARGVASKEEIGMILSEIVRARLGDFMTMGADGVVHNDIGPETLNSAALKKIKTKIQTSSNAETEVQTDRQVDDIELEGKKGVADSLAKLMGYNEPDKHEHGLVGPFTIVTQVPDPDPLPPEDKE